MEEDLCCLICPRKDYEFFSFYKVLPSLHINVLKLILFYSKILTCVKPDCKWLGRQPACVWRSGVGSPRGWEPWLRAQNCPTGRQGSPTEVAWLRFKSWNQSRQEKKKCVLQGKIRKFFAEEEDIWDQKVCRDLVIFWQTSKTVLGQWSGQKPFVGLSPWIPQDIYKQNPLCQTSECHEPQNEALHVCSRHIRSK